MLIIAIPKSASTSLLDTLGKQHKLKNNQLFFKDFPIPSEYKILGKYHSDIREFDASTIQLFYDPKIIYKQHIPPTENNLKFLENRKKVILLRDPKEIIEGYWRAEKKKIHEPRKEFSGVNSKDEWHNRAAEIGLIDEINNFYTSWSNRRDDFTLQITYEELIKNPIRVINEIESFFLLPLSKNITLSKKRYSRYKGIEAKLQDIKRLIYILRRYIVKLIKSGIRIFRNK